MEWVGGNMMMPAAADEPELYETFFWLNADGDLLGTATYVAREMPDRLADSYVATVESPEVGVPHVPARIRVASEQHAAALRRAVGPETEVVCAPTPEVEPVRISLAAYLEKVGSEPDETYLSPGIGEEVVAGLFRAATRFHAAAPWKQLPADQTTASVSIKALGVRRAALVVLGHDGKQPGIQLAQDEAGASALRALLAEREGEGGGLELEDLEDEDDAIPPHLALELVRGADLEPSRRKEIAKHGWPVAGPAAYPELSAFDEDGLLRPASARELAVMEALATALAELVEKKPELVPVLAEQEPFEHAVKVETSRGVVTVELSTALADEGDVDEPEDDDDDAVDDLLERFRASPEHARLKEHHDWASLMLEHARAFFGIRVDELTPVIVEDIVFSSFPSKVSCPPEVAGSLVAELRAFFAFLERERLCPEAGACGRLFDDKAEDTLRDRLSDPRSFGMTKSMIMAGIEAGYDLSTEEGLAAWLGEANEMLDAPGGGAPRHLRAVPAPSSAARTPKKTAKKKAERKKAKAARASRKKKR